MTAAASPSSRLGRAQRVFVAMSALLVLGTLVFAFARPRDFITGGNSVRPQSIIAVVGPGEQVCADAIEVPAGSAGVEVVVGPVGPPGAVDVTLVDGREVVRRGRAALKEFGRTRVMLDGEITTTGLYRMCLRPTGVRMDLAGRQGRFVGDPPLAAGALDAVPAVWFVPPDGERRSLASEWLTSLERAATLQPAWVSPALLFVLVSVLLPAALVGGVILVSRPSRFAPALIVVVSLASSISWATLATPFDGPDEPDHFAYVQSIVERGERTAVEQGGQPAFSSAQTELLDAARHYARIGAQEQVPPWTERARRALEERLSDDPARDNGGGYAESTRIHSPVYYGYASVGYRLAGTDVRAELTGARLMTALLAAIIALCAFGIVREVAPGEMRLAVLAGVITALQPVLSFVSGIVNNDSAANAAAAFIAYATVRLLRRGPDRPTVFALALVLGLAPLLKGTALAPYPPVLVALVFVAWRARRARASLVMLAGGAAVFAAAWIAARAAIRAALDTPAGGEGGAIASGSLLQPLTAKLNYAWQTMLPRVPTAQDYFPQAWPFFDIYVVGSWGVFGWFTAIGPRWVCWVVVGVAALVVASGIHAMWHARSSVGEWGPSVGFLLCVPVAVLVAVAFAYYTPGVRPVPAEQGRYLFTAAAPIAALAALALLGVPARWRSAGAITLTILVAGAAAGARLIYVQANFAGM